MGGTSMALASHPDPVRSKLKTNLLAGRLAGLFVIRMPALGCIRIAAPEGATACAVALRGAAVREPAGTRCAPGGAW